MARRKTFTAGDRIEFTLAAARRGVEQTWRRGEYVELRPDGWHRVKDQVRTYVVPTARVRLSSIGIRSDVQAGAGSGPGASDACVCGHPIEEHGHDDEFPGSTACSECQDCIAYESEG